MEQHVKSINRLNDTITMPWYDNALVLLDVRSHSQIHK